MAMTLRLPEGLAERGRRYAAEVGISLNGLVAVALREYLEVRKPEPRREVSKPEPRRTQPQVQALGQAIARQVKAGPARHRR